VEKKATGEFGVWSFSGGGTGQKENKGKKI
jgi:hypothetical protein